MTKKKIDTQQMIKKPSGEPAEASVSNLPLQGIHILLVEDSPDNQMLIKRILCRNGATVDLADDGAQGVERSLEGKPDVVLMDIQMPIMDGYMAMAKLVEAGFKSPVIALTAHAMEAERSRTLAAGFAVHVTKPIEFRVLIETILSVVSAAKQAGLTEDGKALHK